MQDPRTTIAAALNALIILAFLAAYIFGRVTLEAALMGIAAFSGAAVTAGLYFARDGAGKGGGG